MATSLHATAFGPAWPEDPAGYYGHPEVRRRVLEYCGLAHGSAPGAAYVVALGRSDDSQPSWERATAVRPAATSTLWRTGADIARSLWDSGHLIFLLDLDYLNIDEPDEPFLRPAETFFKLEPAYQAVRRELRRLALDADALMTGRGYHFSGRIPITDAVIAELAALVPDTPPWWPTVAARRPHGVDAPLDPAHARAADGLGLLIEYLAHRVMRAATRSPIPVVFNGTVVGTGLVGRECVSIDFSHVGDPLDTRHVRTAFSTYQWHRLRPDIFGDRASRDVPPLVVLPRDGQSFTDMLSIGRDLAAGAIAAANRPAQLPRVARGVKRLLDDYRSSPLARFHQEFLAETGRETRPEFRCDEDLPPCVRGALDHPNDLLLRPEHLQQIVRSLMARDWHPADIVALVEARYREDHDWGDRWSRMEARTRAAFDVRVFAGMIRTGLDHLVDCNCVSAQEKGLCPLVGCRHDLRRDRTRLEGLRSR